MNNLRIDIDRHMQRLRAPEEIRAGADVLLQVMPTVAES